MLTDIQIKDLAGKLSIPLEAVCFKSTLKDMKLKHNRSYIINLENEIGEDGDRNDGTHWTCFQVDEYPNGKKMACYFDSYGVGPPTEVIDFVGEEIPYNKKDIQSLMNNACGWYCLAYLHFINAFPQRSGDFYDDTEGFLSLFDDLNTSCDFKKNEFILKHFFQASDKSLRKPITVEDQPNTDTIVS